MINIVKLNEHILKTLPKAMSQCELFFKKHYIRTEVPYIYKTTYKIETEAKKNQAKISQKASSVVKSPLLSVNLMLILRIMTQNC